MDGRYIYEFKGVGRTVVTLDGFFIRIKRSSLLSRINHGLTGDRTIDIRHLSGVRVKKAGFFSGFIQFLFLGSSYKGIERFGASVDENSILYVKDEQRMVDEIQQYVENLLKNRNTPDLTPPRNVISEIRQFKELLDDGALTQAEFDEKKKQLLNEYTPKYME